MWLVALAAVLLADPDFATLANQLENRSCDLDDDPFRACELRPWSERTFGWLVLDHPAHRCPLGAVRCLEKLGPRARAAVPALIRNLDTAQDFDTGDGIIPVRSSIARALGAIGDPHAIPPLVAALRRAPSPDYLEALGGFGPAAREATPLVVPLLSQPPLAGAAARALAAFGSTSGDSLRALEACALFPALPADARIDCVRAVAHPAALPTLVQLLRQPALAAAAAEALSRLGPAAITAVPALLTVARQPSLAERQADRRVYSVEVTARLAARIAALRALEIIEPGHAVAFLNDPDLAGVARQFHRAKTPPRSTPPAPPTAK